MLVEYGSERLSRFRKTVQGTTAGVLSFIGAHGITPNVVSAEPLTQSTSISRSINPDISPDAGLDPLTQALSVEVGKLALDLNNLGLEEPLGGILTKAWIGDDGLLRIADKKLILKQGLDGKLKPVHILQQVYDNGYGDLLRSGFLGSDPLPNLNEYSSDPTPEVLNTLASLAEYFQAGYYISQSANFGPFNVHNISDNQGLTFAILEINDGPNQGKLTLANITPQLISLGLISQDLVLSPTEAGTGGGALEPIPQPTPGSTATPEPTPTPRPTATPPPTPTPEATKTPLPPEIYNLEPGVPERDLTIIKEAIGLARSYFVANFGINVPDGIKVNLRTSSIGSNLSISGGCFGRIDTGEMTIDVTHPAWARYQPDPSKTAPIWQNKGSVVHEYFHLLQSNLIRCSRPSGPTWLLEGVAEHIAQLAVSQAGLTSYDRLRACNEARIAYATSSLSLPSLSTLESPERFYSTNYALTLATRASETLSVEKGVKAFRTYWEQLGQGRDWQSAFQMAFGTDIDSFYQKFAQTRSRFNADLEPCYQLSRQP